MSTSPKTEAPAAAFVCDCEDWMRSACDGLPSFKEHEGKRYCVLHYPGEEKVAAFDEALQRKLEAADFDFKGVWFPDEVDFFERTFAKPASFHSATFSAKANFEYATFDAETSFVSATFGAEASFDRATFGAKADFGSATFKDYVIFAGTEEVPVFRGESSLNLQFARIDRPDRVSFHALTLRPHWFVNVNARKFEFLNVNWNWPALHARREIQIVGEKHTSSSYELLGTACRNLAVNAEENHLYWEASKFRYMAAEAWRLGKWRGFPLLTMGWWYWLASGYGERVWRAFVVLAGVWLLAAALYTQVGFVRWEPRVSNEREAAEARRDEVGAPLRLTRALTYSLGVMTLQKPEPRPATDAAQAAVMLETILGPVQAALLALAIRRKFMR